MGFSRPISSSKSILLELVGASLCFGDFGSIWKGILVYSVSIYRLTSTLPLDICLFSPLCWNKKAIVV